MRLDLTVNIPTMAMLFGLVVTTITAGVSIYNTFDRRQLSADIAIAALQVRADKTEGSVNSLKLEQAQKNTELRSEMKSDIGEIKNLLNEVIFGRVRPVQQTGLKEWSKH